jgi:hypothetical protein
VTAVRQLVLLPGGADTTERNQNPTLTGELLVSDVLDGTLIEEGGALAPDREYSLSLVQDEAASETFLPSAPPGAEEGEPRRETLVLSWFVSQGTFPAGDGFGDGGGPGGGGGERTTFVDGQNDFAALLGNEWRLPRRPESSEATLVLVLRDERGGVGWAEHRFAVGVSE